MGDGDPKEKSEEDKEERLMNGRKLARNVKHDALAVSRYMDGEGRELLRGGRGKREEKRKGKGRKRERRRNRSAKKEAHKGEGTEVT